MRQLRTSVFPLGEIGRTIVNINHFSPRSVALALALGSVAALAAPVDAVASTSTSSLLKPFPAATVNFYGHGFGHGRGMGQWGAFGYAAEAKYHKSYKWILSHYYGGTALSASNSVVSSNPRVRVVITSNDDAPVVVTSKSRFTFGGKAVAGGQAARAVLSAVTGKWTISVAGRCKPVKWTTVATKLVNPKAVPYSSSPTAPLSKVLTICRADGLHMPVHGSVEAYDRLGGMRTLSVLPLEEYLRGVVPSEMPASWGLFGGTSLAPQHEPWGFQALEAQAVAARSYAAAWIAGGGWYGYADICDSVCQSYSGILYESELTDAAIADTAGEILTRHGAPVFAEYSSSTGGYTFGGAFPAVPDAGDAVCIKSLDWTCNPYHNWTAGIPVTAVQSAFPQVGRLAAVKIVKRNGLGAQGGRVISAQIVGTKGTTVTVSGDYLAGALGLYSNWFSVTNNA